MSLRSSISLQCVPFLRTLIKTDHFPNTPGIWAGIISLLLIKVFSGVFAFPICAILITQSSPSRELLGTVNGANQALGSLCRALGPGIAGLMYSRSLEVSKPWIVWRYGLGIFAVLVWIGGWFLTDKVVLPNAKGYDPLPETDQDDIIEEEIEEEEERLWREEEDGTIDIQGVMTPTKSPSLSRDVNRSTSKLNDESDGSSDDELVKGVSTHMLSHEH